MNVGFSFLLMELEKVVVGFIELLCICRGAPHSISLGEAGGATQSTMVQAMKGKGRPGVFVIR